MLFGYFTLFVALLIEIVGAYYSITGLAAIFSGAVIPILIMGGSLELGKVTAAVWLKNNWERASLTFKLYLLPAVVMLMLITSMGIFGFLSKAHNDQNLVSGDVLGKIAIYDEKIRIQRDNIESARKALQQMDAAVDQTMSRSSDEKGADKATAIRRGQARERGNLQGEIARAQAEIVKLNDQRAPIAAEVRKVEAEVGPIKYIAKLIYDDNPDANILEKAVVWVIMIIVAVFDPLALVLILAAQQSIRWVQGEEEKPKLEKESVGEWFNRAKKRARFWDQQPEPKNNDIIDESQYWIRDVENIEPEIDQHTHISPEDYYRAMGLFDTAQALTDPYISDSYTKNTPKTNIGNDPHPPGWMFTAQPHPLIDTADPEPIPEPPIPESIPEPPPVANVSMTGVEYIEVNGKRMHHKAFDPHSTDAFHALERHQEKIVADNAPPELTNTSGFGITFPNDPNKGDTHLRVDRLPTTLYKFNGRDWIEVDKQLNGSYVFDEAYIDYLIEGIDSGTYDPELLSDNERDAIASRLKNDPSLN
jgi:hypothetical protein